MKRALVAALLSLITITCTRAQKVEEQPAYKSYPTFLPMPLKGVDSKTFSSNDLPKHKKLLFMYFSPDCEHCKRQTEDILKRMSDFKKISILMVTYQPFEQMVAFHKKYNIKNYPNIKIGRDSAFLYPPFYKMKNLPFLALYDAKGDLITTFDGDVATDKLLASFN